MPTVTIADDVSYAYDEAGQGEPLLLVHAGIADRRMWDDVVPTLSARHRVVRVDLRGFGDTPLPDGRVVHAADLAAVLDALGITRAHVCGVSMGARVVVDLALGHPDLVDRLVLVAAVLPGWTWGPAIEEFDAAETDALERGDLDGASWLNVRIWLDGPTRSPDVVDAGLRHRVHEMQRRAFERDNPAAEVSWLVWDHERRLGEVGAPTLLVVGGLDQPDIADIGRHMLERLPRARLEVMPDVAHLPPMETPDRFAHLVLQHLS